MGEAKILIVEDDLVVAEDIQKRLKNLGYGVSAMVPSGEEAISKVKENNHDLVLMDIVLKGEMDGIEAADQIGTQFNIPVVYLTAYVDEELLERAKMTGPFGYIIKPFEDRELNTAIEIALYKHKIGEEQRKKAELQQIFLDSLPPVAMLLRPQTREIVAANRAGEEVGSVPGKKCYETWGQSGSPCPWCLAPVLWETREEQHLEQFAGGCYWDAHWVPVSEDLYLHYAYDITNQVKAKEALREAHDGLERRVEERTRELQLGKKRLTVELKNRRQAEEDLLNSEGRTRALLNVLSDTAILINPKGIVDAANRVAAETLGIRLDQFIGTCIYDFFPSPLAKKRKSIVAKVIRSKKPIRFQDESEGIIFDNSIYPVINEEGKLVQLAIYAKDITEHVKANDSLKKRELELKKKAITLKETNAALNILLKKREADKQDLEENVISNVKELVEPYVEKLKKSRLDPKQEAYLSVLESGLKEIVSPFLRNLSLKYHKLTPKEFQIATLLKEGKSTKEMAELLESTKDAIDFHRKNLRGKLGIKNKQANLRSHLFSLR